MLKLWGAALKKGGTQVPNAEARPRWADGSTAPAHPDLQAEAALLAALAHRRLTASCSLTLTPRASAIDSRSSLPRHGDGPRRTMPMSP